MLTLTKHMKTAPHEPIPGTTYTSYATPCGQCGSERVVIFDAEIKRGYEPQHLPHGHTDCYWCKDCGSMAGDIPDIWNVE